MRLNGILADGCWEILGGYRMENYEIMNNCFRFFFLFLLRDVNFLIIERCVRIYKSVYICMNDTPACVYKTTV